MQANFNGLNFPGMNDIDDIPRSDLTTFGHLLDGKKRRRGYFRKSPLGKHICPGSSKITRRHRERHYEMVKTEESGSAA